MLQTMEGLGFIKSYDVGATRFFVSNGAPTFVQLVACMWRL
jgi:hypothetical protein